MSRRLQLSACALFLVACRPQQSEIDQIHRKLEELSAQQQQLMQAQEARQAQEAQQDAEQSSQRQATHQQVQRQDAFDERLSLAEAQLAGLNADLHKLEGKGPAKRAQRPGRPDPALRYRMDIGNSHVRGGRDALVTIVAFVDYQCPFSKRVQPTLDKIRKHYGRDVRLVHKHNALPMHNRAEAAALAAEAAGKQGKFWQMHEKLFQDPRALTDENIERYATELGLDMQQFQRDRQDPTLLKRIKAEQAAGAKVGARGTPAFFINGRFVSGAQPFEVFQAAIDEERAAARKMVKKGTKRRKVYETLMKTAKTKV